MKQHLAILTLALATAAHAGTVQLTVTDKDGKPVPDVVVQVQSATKATVTPPAKPVLITQEGSRFIPFLTVVPVGTTLRFINKDGYDHHVRSTPSGPLGAIAPAKTFELRDAAGPIGLGCHIHGSMRGQIFVADTPWAGKTDANGVATLDGVPDGAAQITLWHPDQLQEQAAVPVQVSVTPVKTSTQLNFVPRRRRG
jgi:plastocyanin